MNTENITKAAQSFDLFMADLRAAHYDAIASGNRFAELAIMSAIEKAAPLHPVVKQLQDAAGV